MDLSMDGLSKLRGIGPMILSLGFQPVAMSASSEWLMAGIYSMSLLIYYSTNLSAAVGEQIWCFEWKLKKGNWWKFEYRTLSLNSFLFGFDDDIMDDKGFDEVSVDDSLVFEGFSSEVNKWLFWVNDYVNSFCAVPSTDIECVNLFELALTVVELDLYLSLDIEFSILAEDPLSFGVTGANAEVNEVGWIGEELPLQMGLPSGLISLILMLIFLSL